jgi:hypothetical protein
MMLDKDSNQAYVNASQVCVKNPKPWGKKPKAKWINPFLRERNPSLSQETKVILPYTTVYVDAKMK